MTCPAHPWGNPTGLDCQRVDAHFAGHIYIASDAPDRHTDEASDE